jgi:hypothetical protein
MATGGVCTKTVFFIRVAAFNAQKSVLVRQLGLSLQHSTSKADADSSLIRR